MLFAITVISVLLLLPLIDKKNICDDPETIEEILITKKQDHIDEDLDIKIKEDLLNLIYKDKFEQKEININNKKTKIINLDKDLQNYIWIKYANNFKSNVSKKFKTSPDFFSYVKYEGFYKLIDKMIDMKINDLHNSNLYDVDRDVLRKINE